MLLFCLETAMAQENQDVYVAAKNRSPYNQISQSQGNVKGYVNYVNSKVARHLFKNFGDPNNVQWVIDDQESTAYFSRAGEQIKVRYNKDGGFISTKKTYAGNKLDRYIALLAKKDLDRDFTIYWVTEIATDAGKIYEVILQNRIYWSVVRIAEDKQGYREKVGENETFLKI
jgi:LPS O-antigen subunit length determinant protein (WzzB/FepE family)